MKNVARGISKNISRKRGLIKKSLNLFLVITVLLSIAVNCETVNAGGTYYATLNVGETKYISGGSLVSEAINSGSWCVYGNSAAILITDNSSYGCIIEAVKPTNGKVAILRYDYYYITYIGNFPYMGKGFLDYEVTVNGIDATFLKLSSSSVSLVEGDGFRLNATMSPSNATSNILWSSSNTSVVTVNSEGYLTSQKPGTAVITAKADSPLSPSSRCSVTVNSDGIIFDSQEFVYDGAEHSLAISKLPSGSTVTYSNNNKKNAGQYTVTANINENGHTRRKTATMTIKPKDLTVAGLAVVNKTYDGTTDAAISGGSLSEIISGDEVSGNFPTIGRFASANAENNISVITDDVTLSGSSKSNYTVIQQSGLKGNITKANISVKADDQTVIKGGRLPELTYSITNGKLFGDDKLTGSLASNASLSKTGKYDITQGTLTAGSNYTISFTKGSLSVVDKTPQNISVSDITAKTYGDEGFKVEVTPDAKSGLTEFTYESSNTNVATIDDSGNITIKGAGETNISVKQAGNGEYAAFEKTQKLVVNKVNITVTADAKTKKSGGSDPELTYQYTGKLIGDDKFTGELTRKTGESIGKYDILQGTLALSNNYSLTYNKAVFEIVDKTPQNISVSDITAKTYGDEGFKVEVAPDETSKLSAFIYEIDNKDVATVDNEGNVSIKGVGEATITVTEPGNDDYAPFSISKKIIVNKKNIQIKSISLKEKTAEFEGILTTDTEIKLDFDKLVSSVKNVSENDITSVISSFVLKGNKAENYEVSHKSFEVTEQMETTKDVTATENVEVSAGVINDTAVVTGLDISNIQSGTEKITLDFSGIAEKEVKNVSIPKTVFENIKDTANLELKLNDGKAGENATVVLDKTVLAFLSEASGENITFGINKAENVVTNDKQKETVAKLSNSEVYELSLICDGENITSFNGGKIAVKLVYDKYQSGNVKMVCIKPDGTTETVSSTFDKTTKTINATLMHFSEYAIYTEQTRSSGSGGRSSSNYTVKFETNGGSSVKNVNVKKNATITEPTSPTKDGFIFTGWYTDKSCTIKYDFSNKITNSTTIYAGWKSSSRKNKIILTIGENEAEVFGEMYVNDVAPIIRRNRTMLPARFVAEHLGADVEWDDTGAGIVTVTKDNIEIIIYIDSDEAYVNGEKVILDSPAFIENNRTYTPLRFIAENLGAYVDWDEKNQEVVIIK